MWGQIIMHTTADRFSNRNRQLPGSLALRPQRSAHRIRCVFQCETRLRDTVILGIPVQEAAHDTRQLDQKLELAEAASVTGYGVGRASANRRTEVPSRVAVTDAGTRWFGTSDDRCGVEDSWKSQEQMDLKKKARFRRAQTGVERHHFTPAVSCRSALPGIASVCLPFSNTITPFTITNSMPSL